MTGFCGTTASSDCKVLHEKLAVRASIGLVLLLHISWTLWLYRSQLDSMCYDVFGKEQAQQRANAMRGTKLKLLTVGGKHQGSTLLTCPAQRYTMQNMSVRTLLILLPSPRDQCVLRHAGGVTVEIMLSEWTTCRHQFDRRCQHAIRVGP